MNGQQYARSGVSYTYQPAASVSYISPTSAPSAVVCNATRAPAGESRVEVSNNAREYTSSGVRVRLVSLRVLDVQPWSGPVGGATVVSVRAHGVWPGGVRCRIGESTASAALCD